MPKLQILYWHDIPTQVRVRAGRTRVSRPLPDRFMQTVDKVAMAARLTGTDAYMGGFKWGPAEEREGDPEAIADATVAELVSQFETIEWRGLARRLREEEKEDQ